jgi:SpoVK/Ycf46/Vps4 family AAA+-type ATPase
MGVAGEEFIPSNYAPHVVDDYRHVVKDLNSMDPCGFVTLLNGPPGSGKTHMVRAMMNEVPKATFILVPSNMIASLGSPDFMGLLLREQRKDAPMILFVEDADEAIVDRKDGNKSAISALLNFSDGIFGALLNIRIVCTTNVKIAALDAAVMRKGRLCREIEVGELDGKQANEIYKRLTGKEGEYKNHKSYILADIYDDAKNTGRVEREKKPTAPKVGFTLPTKQEALEVFDEMSPVKENPGDVPVYHVTHTSDGEKMTVAGFVSKEDLEKASDTDSAASPEAPEDPYDFEKEDELEADDDSDLIDEDPDPDDDEPDFITEDPDDDKELTDDHYHDTNPGDDWTEGD